MCTATRAAWLPTSCLVVRINKPEGASAHDIQSNLQNVSYRWPYEKCDSLVYLIITNSTPRTQLAGNKKTCRYTILLQIPPPDTTLRQANTKCKIILHK